MRINLSLFFCTIARQSATWCAKRITLSRVHGQRYTIIERGCFEGVWSHEIAALRTQKVRDYFSVQRPT